MNIYRLKSTSKIYIFLVLVALVVVIIFAQGIIIPFVLAILFWFMIRVIRKMLAFVFKRWPRWALTVISSLLMLGFLFLIVHMISSNIRYLTETWPQYEGSLSEIKESIDRRFNFRLTTILNEFSSDLHFGGILSNVFTTLTNLFAGAFTVLIYLVFILIEEPTFHRKLRKMYPDPENFERMELMVKKIDQSVSKYLAIKTMASFLTGFLSFFALIFIGIDAPFFWAFLIFILNFIPSIGSLVATFFPAIFAVFQFGTFTPAILVLAIVGFIQVLVGNFLEPRVMGNTMNMSPLVVFLTLMLWGLIWGIPGMLLSVPITVILIIIMSEFDSTRPIAILLSRNGDLVE